MLKYKFKTSFVFATVKIFKSNSVNCGTHVIIQTSKLETNIIIEMRNFTGDEIPRLGKLRN